MKRSASSASDGMGARRFSRRSLLKAGGMGILGLAGAGASSSGLGQEAKNRDPILWTADWNSSGKRLAVGGNDGSLRVFSADLALLETRMMNASVQCVDWNRDGKTLAIALDGRPAEIWDVETGETTAIPIPKDEKGERFAGSRALSWNPQGDRLAVGDYDGRLQIRAKDGTLIRSIETEGAKTYLCVDWHPSKDLIVTGSDVIRIFDVSQTDPKPETKTMTKTMTIKHRPEDAIVLTARWHPQGTFFAIGDYGHDEIESLLQFRSEDGTLLKSMSGSKAEYRNIRWSPQGKFLASASDALRIWTKDGQLAHKGESPDLLWGLDWNERDRSIATSSAKGAIRVWTEEAELAGEAR